VTRAALRLAAVFASMWLVAGCHDAIQPSSAMAPTIKPGEKVTINHTAYATTGPKRWDVIAFEPPGHTNQVWLKRVVGLPGETVSFATGGIAINGHPLAMPPHLTNLSYVPWDQMSFASRTSIITSPYVIPPSCYFVLGDNSTNSNDSRFWGAVPRTNILGRVRNK
jgi:signal peptidase I